ncbi:MAG: hypothetical protein PUA83_07390 [Clostridiales bacterium]|nr:hypothetical protein [Clostridiales bacterium]
MTLYGRFRRMKLDTSPVGLIVGERRSGYFCSPRGAEVIGWAGVDGIHYCFVRGFGETVFAVDPTDTPGNYVRPVAGSFEDFLRLICAVGDAAVLQQLHAWTKDFFDDFLRKNPLTPEQLAVIGKIGEKFGISPMEDPYACVKRVQEGFDPGALKFGPDYYEWVAEAPKKPEEWKVFWGKSFWEGGGRSRAGEELRVEKRFVWDGETWYIPCVYACTGGLVADMFKEVSGEAVCEFEKKRNCANFGENPETEESFDAENPLREEFSVRAEVNGRELSESYACGDLWVPEGLVDGLPEPEPAAGWTLEHYGLDRSKCWVMRRVGFPWAGKKPKIVSAGFTLSADAISIPGPCFSLAKGESAALENPATGERCVLTVKELSREELPESAFPDGPEEFPRMYTAMTYTLEPDVPEREISVCDCEKGDSPRPKTPGASLLPDGCGVACLGVIGGADGPTALFPGGSGALGQVRFAVSSLRFAQPEKIRWRVLFRRVPKEDVRVRIL